MSTISKGSASAADRAARIADVRAFNRFYTSQVGALGDAHLDSAYALTEARVLYELARAEPPDSLTAADLVRLLALDPSHLSRILRRFEADGLLARERSGTDARRRTLTLTADGRERFTELNGRASDEIGGLLDALSEPDQRSLLDALRTAGRLLGHRTTDPRVAVRGLRPGDLGWVVARNAVLYAQEYGWDQTYEGLVASIVASYASSHDPELENAWVAELDGQPVGFVMCVRRDTTTAQLRLLLVEPYARGHGIGSLLVETCVAFAKRAGFPRLVLWTNDPLVAARRIYERAGFELVEEEAHTSFGHRMVGQYLALDL